MYIPPKRGWDLHASAEQLTSAAAKVTAQLSSPPLFTSPIHPLPSLLSLLLLCVYIQCALELSQHSNFLYSQDFDAITNSCLRALDGSSYIVRCSVSKLFGTLLSLTQKPLPKTLRGKLKLLSLEEALTVLSNGLRKAAVVSFMYGSARTAPGISSGLRTTRAFSGVTSPLFGVLTTVTPRPFGASTSDKDRQTRGRFQY